MDQAQQLHSFSYYWRRSFLLHLLLVLLFAGISYLGWKEIEKKKVYNLKLAQASVRVDVVAMPTLTFKELKKLESISRSKVKAPPIVKKEPVKVETPDKGNEFIKKKKNVSLSDILNKYKKKPQKQVKQVKEAKKVKIKKKENQVSSELQEKLNNLVLEGNQVSKGTKFAGSGYSEEEQSIFNQYTGKLPDIIRGFWKLPSYLADLDLRCRIKIHLNSTGKIIQTEVIESSGEEEFDKRALEALAQSRFPRIDERLLEKSQTIKVVVGFPL